MADTELQDLNGGVPIAAVLDGTAWYVVDDPTGTPVSKYATSDQIATYINTANQVGQIEILRVRDVFDAAPNTKTGLVLYAPLLEQTEFRIKDYAENHKNGVILGALTNTATTGNLNPAHNGFAIGTTYNYTFDLGTFARTDKSWTVLQTQSDPFTPMTAAANGNGSCKFYNEKLYVLAFNNVPTPYTEETIAIFNADTLAYESEFDISATPTNPAGMEIVSTHGDNGIIYVISKTLSEIYTYDLSDGSFIKTITVTPTLPTSGSPSSDGPQDLTWRNGYFYLHENTTEKVIRIDLAGNARDVVETDETPAQQNQGINWSDQDELLLHFSNGTDHIKTYEFKDFYLSDTSTSRMMNGSARSHRIVFPSSTATDNLTTFTMSIWIEHDGTFTGATTNHLIYHQFTGDVISRLLWIEKSGTDDATLNASIGRLTTNTAYKSSTLLAKDTLYFCACTFDDSRGDAERFDIYIGDTTSNTVQEVSYKTPTEGSGAINDSTGFDISILGREQDALRNHSGKGAYARIYNRVLAIEELQQIFDAEKP